jgi:hypothetical protein
MKGHENLIQMRLNGRKPKALWVYLQAQPKSDYHWDTFTSGLDMPEVFIEPRENIRTLDLRFVVGLTVHVVGGNEERVRAIVRALEDAKAKAIYAVAGDQVIVSGADYARSVA